MGARSSVMVVGPDRSVFCRIVDQLARSPTQQFDLSWSDCHQAAIERLEEDDFDVCIADLALGRDALEEIAREVEERELATTFIPLGDDGYELQRDSLAAGGAAFLLRSEIDTRGLEAAVAWGLAHGRARERRDNLARRIDVLERGCEIGLWHWDTALDFVRLSDKASRILGISETSCEVSLPRLLAVVSPEARDRVQEEFDALRRGTCAQKTIEFRIDRRGGKSAKVALHVQSSNTRGGSKVLIGGSMRCLDNASQSTPPSVSVAGPLGEGLAFSMLEAAARPMLQVAEDGRIVYVNPAAAELFGYCREEITKLNLADILLRPAEKEEGSPIDWICEQDAPGDSSGSRSCLGRCASGEKIAVEYWSRPMGSDKSFSFVEVSRIETRENTAGAYLGFGVPDFRASVRNRRAFTEQIALGLARTRRERAHSFAVVYIGIERYASYLDALGKQGAQTIVDRLTSRLRACLRPQDAVCPLDEGDFLVLLEAVSEQSDALRIAERMQEVLHCRVDVAHRGLYATCRMGISMGSRESIDANDIVREAHHAMLTARAQRLAVARIFQDEEHRKAWNRLKSERSLRDAVMRNELELFYQPVVSLGGGRLLGFEALVRWRGGDGTLRTPAEFMEIAAQTGLVIPLGRWVIREACLQLAQWGPMLGDAKSKIAISVNLSTHEAIQPDLIPVIREILHETNAAPDGLHLEIREDLLGMPDGYGEKVISRLNGLGVGVVLDGLTAQSPILSNLQHIPVEVVKLDRSFLDDMRKGLDHRAMIETVVSLGNRVGKGVVVVGIESEYQAAHLGTLGCHGGQGYYFSKPMSAKEATKYLGRRPPAGIRNTLVPV